MRCPPAPSNQGTDRQLQRIGSSRGPALRDHAAALPTLSPVRSATVALDRASADIPLTRSAREDLEQAANEAARRGADESNPVDVLRAVVSNRGSLAVNTMRGLGTDPEAVAAALPADGVAPALPLRQLLVNANREAQVLGHYSVDSIHLLLAMLYSDSHATAAMLQKAGLRLYDVRQHLQTSAKDFLPGESDRQSSRSSPQRGRTDSARPRATPPPDAALRRKPLPVSRGVVQLCRE